MNQTNYPKYIAVVEDPSSWFKSKPKVLQIYNTNNGKRIKSIPLDMFSKDKDNIKIVSNNQVILCYNKYDVYIYYISRDKLEYLTVYDSNEKYKVLLSSKDIFVCERYQIHVLSIIDGKYKTNINFDGDARQVDKCGTIGEEFYILSNKTIYVYGIDHYSKYTYSDYKLLKSLPDSKDIVESRGFLVSDNLIFYDQINRDKNWDYSQYKDIPGKILCGYEGWMNMLTNNFVQYGFLNLFNVNTMPFESSEAWQIKKYEKEGFYLDCGLDGYKHIMIRTDNTIKYKKDQYSVIFRDHWKDLTETERIVKLLPTIQTLGKNLARQHLAIDRIALSNIIENLLQESKIAYNPKVLYFLTYYGMSNISLSKEDFEKKIAELI